MCASKQKTTSQHGSEQTQSGCGYQHSIARKVLTTTTTFNKSEVNEAKALIPTTTLAQQKIGKSIAFHWHVILPSVTTLIRRDSTPSQLSEPKTEKTLIFTIICTCQSAKSAESAKSGEQSEHYFFPSLVDQLCEKQVSHFSSTHFQKQTGAQTHIPCRCSSQEHTPNEIRRKGRHKTQGVSFINTIAQRILSVWARTCNYKCSQMVESCDSVNTDTKRFNLQRQNFPVIAAIFLMILCENISRAVVPSSSLQVAGAFCHTFAPVSSLH